MKFEADNTEYWSKDNTETVFFGHASTALALLLSGNAEGHYLEWNDQSNTAANAVSAISISGQTIDLQLTETATQIIGESSFTVDCTCNAADFKEISDRLALIFGKKLTIKPGKTAPKPAPAKDYSTIRYLNLEGKKLRQLPDYVRDMTALETAKLAHNPDLDMQAAIEVLATLPHLKTLEFSTLKTMPDNLGRLSSLESLTISGVTEPTTLPDSIGDLQQLTYFMILSDADVILPDSFANLGALENLYIRAPGWQMPAEFYRLTRLNQLDLSNGRLKQVPEAIVQMTQVAFVILGNHDICDYAQVLPLIARMPAVKSLEMNVNPVPEQIGLCQQVEELTIWTGYGDNTPQQLPDTLFDLGQLQSLILSANYFEAIPSGIGRLTNLKELVFRESTFEQLPESIGNLSGLERFVITENPALKALPDSFGQLSNLKFLYLEDNPLLEDLPESAKNLTNLEEINIPDSSRYGNLPEHWKPLLI